jgi:hypothetical protein
MCLWPYFGFWINLHFQEVYQDWRKLHLNGSCSLRLLRPTLGMHAFVCLGRYQRRSIQDSGAMCCQRSRNVREFFIDYSSVEYKTTKWRFREFEIFHCIPFKVMTSSNKSSVPWTWSSVWKRHINMPTSFVLDCVYEWSKNYEYGECAQLELLTVGFKAEGVCA